LGARQAATPHQGFDDDRLQVINESLAERLGHDDVAECMFDDRASIHRVVCSGMPVRRTRAARSHSSKEWRNHRHSAVVIVARAAPTSNNKSEGRLMIPVL
jgi:hypothetical protein